MDIDVQTLDWRQARRKVQSWQPEPRAKNIFAGRVEGGQADVGGVPSTRITIRPLKAGSKDTPAEVLNSYAVVDTTTAWKKVEAAPVQLPESLKLTWLQANPGRFDLHFDLPQHIRCIGLGERFSDLNLRGAKHTLVSTDNPHHNEHADALYKSIPFLILADDETDSYTGIFVDSPAPQRYDLDSELTGEGKIELFTRRGFNLYVFGPTTLPQLIQAFTQLTGRAALPPLWALGHQQSRWSYPDEETIRELAQEFRNRKIPCDTLVLDIDYMDDYRVFTHSKERFPAFSKLASEMAESNLKLITIVDPGVKKDDKFSVYQEGKKSDLFCQTSQGEIFYERVWPGVSAFPDFLNPKTRDWWAQNLEFYVKNGIAGIWNDMNEPAMFGNQTPLPRPLIEMPPDEEQLFMQYDGKEHIGHFEVRNLYGTLMSMAAQQGLLQHRPQERPFVLTRSASTGIQRYSAVWLGDNTSWWDHLQKSVPMLLNMGLSGVTFAGVDIGGFAGDTTAELLTRWYEVGIFYPFFRNHCALNGRSQEPFAFSPRVENMIRRLIAWRYKLLPYIQGLFYEHTKTGAPLMRPLSWHFNDPRAAAIDDQFMFGADILVAPITKPNESGRHIYFPEGNWYAIDPSNESAGQKYPGGQAHFVPCPLGQIPAFVREGAIIPMASPMQNTAEYSACEIEFRIFGDSGTGIYYEDDGISFAYQAGGYGVWEIKYANGSATAKRLDGKVSAAHKYFAQAADSPGRSNLSLS